MEENKTDNNIDKEMELLNNPSTDEPIVPAAETTPEAEQPITHNPPPVTQPDMEVHHHAHDPAAPHHKKKLEKLFLGIFNVVSRCFLRIFSRVSVGTCN